MGLRRTVHRNYYQHAKPGQQATEVTPLIKADSLVTPAGIKLSFALGEATLTPPDLVSLARWLYSLSHEADDLAREALITESQGYDVEKQQPVQIVRKAS